MKPKGTILGDNLDLERTADALKYTSFYLIFFMDLLGVMFGTFIASSTKSIGYYFGIFDDEFLTTVLSISFVANGQISFIIIFNFSFIKLNLRFINF